MPTLLVQEFPSIRVCKSKPVGDEPGPQIQVSKDVGMELIDRLRQYQRAKQLPSTPTCDLIIAHRSVAILQGRAQHAYACRRGSPNLEFQI